jgi:hypothetical protein
MKKQLLLAATAIAVGFASCKKDDTTPAEDMKIPYSSLTTTSNYFQTFKDAAGATTVNFDGQTTRISMLKELDAYIKTGISTNLDAEKMGKMFKNEGSPFSNAALNAATDKTIISKTAQSFSPVDADAERQRFLGYFTSLAETSTHNGSTAAVGVAGLLDAKYLVNAKGFEYAQLVQKGLIGAMMLDQINNIYLGTEKMNADNAAIVSGKNYTALEHHWDEAYGYLTSNEFYPKPDPNDAAKWLESFLGSYVRQVGPAAGGDPAAVYMAFLKGRAAIVNKDMATRDQQIAFLRDAMERAIATICISYLNKTKTATSDGAKFHSLAEGTGFLYALRFAYNAKVNKTKSDELMQALMGKPNGFWDLTNADIDAVRDQVSALTGVDKNVVVNH